MNQSDADKRLRELIARAFVPPALWQNDPAAIEAMLDAAGGEPLPDDQVERMLKKAKGELPIGERPEPDGWEAGLNEEEEALVALHRSEGGELPEEILEKLRRLREKAQTESELEGGSDS